MWRLLAVTVVCTITPLTEHKFIWIPNFLTDLVIKAYNISRWGHTADLFQQSPKEIKVRRESNQYAVNKCKTEMHHIHSINNYMISLKQKGKKIFYIVNIFLQFFFLKGSLILILPLFMYMELGLFTIQSCLSTSHQRKYSDNCLWTSAFIITHLRRWTVIKISMAL